MSAELVYLVAAVATFVGWGLVIRAVYLGIRLLMGAGGFDPAGMRRSALVSAGVGAVLVVLAAGMPKPLGREGMEGLWLPVVWPYAPLAGWILIGSAVMAVSKLIGLQSVIRQDQYGQQWRAIGVWLAVAGLGWWWLASSGEKIWVLRGQLPLHLPVVLALVVLALVSMVVMVVVERQTRARGLAQGLIRHLALLAGCVVFGIPFAWLLVTSFKEERDIANSDGLVWTPQVQLTHPYQDQERPLVETTFDGRAVRARIDTDLGDGKLLVEAERPYSLRGRRFEVAESSVTRIPRMQFVWSVERDGESVTVFTVEDLPTGDREVEVLAPAALKGERFVASGGDMEPVRRPGLRWENYTEAMEWMPLETWYGLRYLTNTLWLVLMSVVGTVLSCALVAYGFSRLRFPGREQLFSIMLATMMLPAAVTLLPQFLIFRGLGWVDTMLPLWVPTFFAGAFNVFLLRQFFSSIPMELEEAARIDGASYFATFWRVMLPQVKPAMAVIAIWTFMGAWNNFMGPLVYLSSPEKMPVAYALQLFSSDRGTEPGLMMAFATMTVVPVLLLFFFAQRYFIEGVQLSGLGGR